MGGDNLFEDDLKDFLRLSYKLRYPCLGLYDVGDKEEAKRFGIVKLNSRKRVVEFEEKPKRPKSTLSATCIYFFPKNSLKLLDLFVSTHDNVDAAGRYIAWLSKKTKVYGEVFKGEWLDIGHKDTLKVAEKIFK